MSILGDRKKLGGFLVEGNSLLSEVHVIHVDQELLDWDARFETWRSGVQTYLARRMPYFAGYFTSLGDQPHGDTFSSLAEASRGLLHIRETSLGAQLRRLSELMMKI